MLRAPERLGTLSGRSDRQRNKGFQRADIDPRLSSLPVPFFPPSGTVMMINERRILRLLAFIFCQRSSTFSFCLRHVDSKLWIHERVVARCTYLEKNHTSLSSFRLILKEDGTVRGESGLSRLRWFLRLRTLDCHIVDRKGCYEPRDKRLNFSSV